MEVRLPPCLSYLQNLSLSYAARRFGVLAEVAVLAPSAPQERFTEVSNTDDDPSADNFSIRCVQDN